MSIGIDFLLRARTEKFRAGMAEVRNALAATKKAAAGFGFGDALKGAGFGILIGAAVRGFASMAREAQALTVELERQGKVIPANVAALARAGDALKLLKGVAFDAAGGVAGFMEKVGMFAGKVVYGSDAAADAQKRLAEEAKAAAKAVADSDLETAKNERKQFQRDRTMGGAPDKKLALLFNEETDARDNLTKLQKSGNASAADLQKAELAVEKSSAAFTDYLKAVGDSANDRARKRAEGVAGEMDRRTETVMEGVGGVDGLAGKSTGGFVDGNDPRLKARQILEQEQRAQMLYDRGDVRGGLALSEKAKGMRSALDSQVGGAAGIEAKGTELAMTAALKATNDRLEKIEKALGGKFKNQ